MPCQFCGGKNHTVNSTSCSHTFCFVLRRITKLREVIPLWSLPFIFLAHAILIVSSSAVLYSVSVSKLSVSGNGFQNKWFACVLVFNRSDCLWTEYDYLKRSHRSLVKLSFFIGSVCWSIFLLKQSQNILWFYVLINISVYLWLGMSVAVN